MTGVPSWPRPPVSDACRGVAELHRIAVLAVVSILRLSWTMFPRMKAAISARSPWWQRGTMLAALTLGVLLSVLLWRVPSGDPLTLSSFLLDRTLSSVSGFVARCRCG